MLLSLALLLLIAATFGIGVVGSLAGLVLGNLRLPLLLTQLSPSFAGGSNVAISGASAGAGALVHLWAGRFDRRAFVVLAPPSIVGAVVGGYLAGLVPGMLIVLLVGVIVIEQGVELIRSTSKARGRSAAAGSPEIARDRAWSVALGGAGFLIGVLGGLVGLILGTIRLPVMLRAGVGTKDAIATNLSVGFFVGVAGLIGHLLSGTVDLWFVLVLSPPAIAGSLLGARLAGQLSEGDLKRAIGCILLGVGALLLILLATGFPSA
ncbi:MAG: sulfite exporter TauE/SafE family protein [Thermoplasmata archaeon]|nr:sulfite exporter TauE/SafE family protein [Thermoplasmata archaeon]